MVALNRSLARAGLAQVMHRRWKPIRGLARFVGKMRLQRNLFRLPRRAFVVALAWPNDGRAFPFGYLWEVIPCIYDCWPPDYPKWESVFRRNRTRIAFFSARGSAEHFRDRVPGMACYWLPEACDPAEYQPDRPLRDREIDVLEIGRKYLRYHRQIKDALGGLGRRHVFSSGGFRSLVFPDQPSLLAGLGNSKVSICFPKSMTHPGGPGDRETGRGSGGLETVTLRFFESLASKCVPVGHGPAELVELFGYNPVVEADLDDPAGQLEHILSSIDDYQEMVDSNHVRLLEVGTWDKRVELMLSVLKEHGWPAP
jgi:hypothetical protein